MNDNHIFSRNELSKLLKSAENGIYSTVQKDFLEYINLEFGKPNSKGFCKIPAELKYASVPIRFLNKVLEPLDLKIVKYKKLRKGKTLFSLERLWKP